MIHLFSIIITRSFLDDYIDNDIKILFSHNDHILIAESRIPYSEKPIDIVNNFYLNKDYNHMCKLTRNKNLYSIKIGTSYLCVTDDAVHKCKEYVDFFTIKEKAFGYLIQKGTKCLTYKGKLYMSRCGQSNQMFIFEKFTPEELCKLEGDDFEIFTEDSTKMPLDMVNDPVQKAELEKKRDEEFKKVLSKYVDNIENKPKMRKIAKNLYKAGKGWSWPSYSLGYLKGLFCPS